MKLTLKYFEKLAPHWMILAAIVSLPCAHAKPAKNSALPSKIKPEGVIFLNLMKGTFSPRETSFDLPDLKTDPFDYEQSDVRVKVLYNGGQSVLIPAFFDGSTKWRARFTPERSPSFEFAEVQLNGQKIETRLATRTGINDALPVSGTITEFAGPGFVRLDKEAPKYFRFDNGTPYFPLGHNQAWKSGDLPDIPVLFDKMGAVKENWSRVWMNHWDGKNLDWPLRGKLGDLNLDVARRWDEIVRAASRNGIYFQMTLQHHGQYSSTTNPNWNDNPYNTRNGGFLDTPEEFFTNSRARALTKRKLRYAVARWGYAPSILAWELFNEVQFTDAAKQKKWDDIAAWHREMAAFLRAQDPYHHLITTSSSGDLTPSVWADMDYYQEHSYPSDVMLAMSEGQAAGLPANKPFFIGEFGGSAENGDDPGVALHEGLWASLFSGASGAAQYWYWDGVEKYDLYPHFAGAAKFVQAAGLAARHDWKRLQPAIETASRGDLSFGPGAGWGTAEHSAFVVPASGAPLGIGRLPKFLQGQNHREMNPQPLSFAVDYPRGGRFSVQLSQVAKAGAHLSIAVDGKATQWDWPAAEKDTDLSGAQSTLGVDVAAGKHLITLQNSGQDWMVINRFTLSNYAPALSAMVLGTADNWTAWVFQRANLSSKKQVDLVATSGIIEATGLRAGRYRVVWMDTLNGRTLQSTLETAVAARPLRLTTPMIARDVAVYLQRGSEVSPLKTRRQPGFILRPRLEN